VRIERSRIWTLFVQSTSHTDGFADFSG